MAGGSNRRIDALLHGDGERADNSLRGKSLKRAKSGQVPKTLTPHEWEQWYAEHGVPDSHRTESEDRPTNLWQRLAFWRR